jgi:hypothetical protein
MMGGPDFKIRAGDKEFCFEFHPYLGPTIIGKRGNPVSTMPPQNSPFWDALYWWIKQGKQVGADGYCIFKWEMQPVNILKHLGGRNYRILA